MKNTFIILFFITIGLWQNIGLAEPEKFRDGEDLRLVLGLGGVYEGINLDGTMFWGAGPAAELDLEFRLAKYSAFGIGLRYRLLSALGPADSTDTASLIKVSNTDLFLYGKFGWLHLLAGVENFSGTLLLVGNNGNEVKDNLYLPIFGAGTTLFSSGRYKGRLHGVYSYGTVFGYAYASVQANLTLTVNLP